jgi:O-antigen ligase
MTPNNIVLNLLAENGVLGLLFFSGLILSLGFRMWSYLRSRTPGTIEHTTMIGLTYGLLSMAIQYLFSAYIYFPHFWVMIGLVIACMAISDASPKPVDSPKLEAITV